MGSFGLLVRSWIHFHKPYFSQRSVHRYDVQQQRCKSSKNARRYYHDEVLTTTTTMTTTTPQTTEGYYIMQLLCNTFYCSLLRLETLDSTLQTAAAAARSSSRHSIRGERLLLRVFHLILSCLGFCMQGGAPRSEIIPPPPYSSAQIDSAVSLLAFLLSLVVCFLYGHYTSPEGNDDRAWIHHEASSGCDATNAIAVLPIPLRTVSRGRQTTSTSRSLCVSHGGKDL